MKKHVNYMLAIIGVFTIAYVLSSNAQSQEYYPALDAHQHGYEHGYRDGFERGRDARVHNGSSDFHTSEFEHADRGYEAYMGERELFRNGYRDGYRAGYADGFGGNRGRFGEIYRNRDYDADRDRAADRNAGLYVERHWGYRDVASDVGYRDGLALAQKMQRQGIRFAPRNMMPGRMEITVIGMLMAPRPNINVNIGPRTNPAIRMVSAAGDK